jgi:sulfur transfer complex TusBCD TusB component (DsrH family)
MERAIESSTAQESLHQLRCIVASQSEIIASQREAIASLEGKNSALQSTLDRYIVENDLLARKLAGTKSERTNTSEFQLLLKGMLPEEEDF